MLFSDLILRKMTEGSLRTDPRASDMASTPKHRLFPSSANCFPSWALFASAIAQLVEHVIRNDGVTGSSPVCGTTSHLVLRLSAILALGSVGFRQL